LALEQKIQIKNEVLSELMEEHTRLKKLWGSLNGQLTDPDLRSHVIDFIGLLSKIAEIKVPCFVDCLGITSSKYYHWKTRYGKVNFHNGTASCDHWLEEWEKEAIVRFWYKNPLEGYRRCTYMMMDQDIVAVSQSRVYRVLMQSWINETVVQKGEEKRKRFCATSRCA
jgi:putative transposase